MAKGLFDLGGKVAAYLASAASAFHSGDIIVIDGASVIMPAYPAF